MGKTIKSHTAAVWLVMVFIWLDMTAKSSETPVNFLDICDFQKRRDPAKTLDFSDQLFNFIT